MDIPYLYGYNYILHILFGLNADYMHYQGLLSYLNNAITDLSKRHGGTNLRAKRRRVRARPSNQEGHEIRKETVDTLNRIDQSRGTKRQ